ncbi:hypothetical protein QAD02_003224 [Eretmocerus hayati]|uniref:Uncharacterized protein n=1 Tax=Eretmocerus hayati TaxID=131215 RepID=A0ACC2NL29_9HYME|nr:hypothetical protein QAD02_003224 [Eretmocerus hayati]
MNLMYLSMEGGQISANIIENPWHRQPLHDFEIILDTLCAHYGVKIDYIDDYPVFKRSTVEYQSDHLEHDVLDYEVRFTEDAEVLCKADNGQIPYDTATYKRSAQGDDNEGPARQKTRSPWNDEWLVQPDFIEWLEADPNDRQRFICRVCNRKSNKFYQRSCIAAHHARTGHQDALQAARRAGTVVENVLVGRSNKDRVKEFEMILAVLFADHRVSIHFINDLLPVIQRFVADDPAHPLSRMRMREDKCSALIYGVLYTQAFSGVADILDIVPYSFGIDESTGTGNIKLLCVTVQYRHPVTGEIKIHLLSIIKIDPTKGTADLISEAYSDDMRKKRINIQKATFMMADNASLFQGLLNGFGVIMKQYVGHLTVLSCICHSLALIAKKSGEQLHEDLDFLMRRMCSWFKKSGKREEELRLFIVELNIEVKKVMSYSGTRWLESYKCYDLLYTYWQALLGYFTLEAFEHSGDPERARIRDLLNDKRLQALAGFLVYNLNFFNTFNAKYQSKKLLAHKLWRDTETFVHDVGSNYVNPVALPEITSDVFCIAESRRELSQIIVGEKCDRVMEGMPADDKKWVLEYAEQFYVTAITEMRKRLFIHRNLFERLIFMEPRVALGEDRSFDNIRYVCENHLTFLDAEATRLEWERLPQSFTRDQIVEYSDLDAEDFWKIIMNLKENDVVQYPKLIELSAAISCIPHSNAEPERSFSDVNEVRDPLGNQTGIKLLNARCFLRSYVHAYPQKDAIHFVPNAEHFALFNKDMYTRFHSDD